MNQFLLTTLLLLAFFTQHPALGQGQVPAPLSGQWKGPLKLLGGEITLVITIVPLTNGTYYAALDAPQQRISRMPVEVELKGDNLVLKIEQAGSSFVGKVLDNGAKLDGIWTQPGISAPLVLRRAAASVQAATKFKATPPYRETDVSFLNPATRQHLGGTLTVPAGEGPFAAVVLLSDSGPQNRDVEVPGYRMFGQLADYLTRHGIAVLRFDDRGVGQSGGTLVGTTSADYTTDAQAALTWLRAQPGIRKTQVGLVGHSQGGTAAIGAAIQPAGPDFLVLLAAPGIPGDELIVQQSLAGARLQTTDAAQLATTEKLQRAMTQIVQKNPDNAVAHAQLLAYYKAIDPQLAARIEPQLTVLTSPDYRHLLADRPAQTLAKVHCPVLALGGSKDIQVPTAKNLAATAAALQAGGNRDVTVKELPGLNHLFQTAPTGAVLEYGTIEETFAPAALQLVGDWITQHTRK